MRPMTMTWVPASQTSELVEALEHIFSAAVAFDDNDVGGGRPLVGLEGRGRAAHLNLEMRLRKPAILAGRLHGGSGLHRLAEGLHRDARRRRDMIVPCAGLGRHAAILGGLRCVLDHFPRSLILPLS